jgi:DNA-binding response OmpR family regulator
MDARTVLVVEDERDMAQLLKLHLSTVCDEVEIASNGHDGLSAAQRRPWGLIILDLGLPGIGGLEICRRLREKAAYTPVLMLTANGSESARVRGLEIGADDYVTKPFCLQELLARVKAIFRRCAALQATADAAGPGTVRYRDLCLDLSTRVATLGGRQVALTVKEFDLLLHFMTHPERIYSRAQLLDQVWGHGYLGYEHMVNSHINRLRAKIEPDPAHPGYVVTVWGVGYRLG